MVNKVKVEVLTANVYKGDKPVPVGEQIEVNSELAKRLEKLGRAKKAAAVKPPAKDEDSAKDSTKE